MLTRETIKSLIACRLSHEEIREELSRLTFERLTLEDMRAFVEAVQETVLELESGCNLYTAYSSVLDCSGTGGSGRTRFNTSTAVAFVVACAGVKVAKFGNRAARGGAGSFDLLEALSIGRQIAPELVPQLLDQVGLAFLFAPQYYPGLAALSPVRRSLSEPTIFNAIGPLLHPLRPRYRVMGTSSKNVHRLAARMLAGDTGTKRAMVVRAANGLDEIDPAVDTSILNVDGDTIIETTVSARPVAVPDSLGGDLLDSGSSLDIFNSLIENEAHPYIKQIVSINAAACFKTVGTVNTIEEGESLARELIESGAMKAKLEQMRRAYAAISS